MNTMTLREVCDSLGVSRRTVQGYEKAGLVKPTGNIWLFNCYLPSFYKYLE